MLHRPRHRSAQISPRYGDHWFAVIFVLFTAFNVFLTLNKHSHTPRNTYHDELWADRAGYFVHLPAFFVTGLDAEGFPLGLDTLTGDGFSLSNGSMRTKYTCGVALLLAPLYVTMHVTARALGVDDGPFGNIDHLVVDLAGPIAMSMGAYLLLPFLLPLFGRARALLFLLCLYGSTGLLYYTIDDPGMSHVHSFFLFSLLLNLLHGCAGQAVTVRRAAAIGVVIGLILLIRPTNFIFIIAALLVTLNRWNHLFTEGLRPALSVLLIVPVAIMTPWIPQCLYWHHTFGHWVHWSYAEEGFDNWRSPDLLPFLFSPNNGVLPYTPAVVLFLWGCLILWQQGSKLASSVIASTFILLCWVCASWWVWHFGCGFGSRNLVEYSALFSLPLAAWTQWARSRWGGFAWGILLLLVAYQVKLVYSYGDCWFGGDWDWNEFSKLLFGPTK